MSLRVVPKQRALAFGITLVLLAGLSCDGVTAPPTTGGIELGLSSESVVALNDVRITVSGPVTRTVTFGPRTGGPISLSMADVPPGTYTVIAAGLVGGRVAQYGETSGITVRAGGNSSAYVALSGFQPVVSTAELSDTVRVLHFNVTYTAVPHATSYVVEWSKSPTMTDAASTVVTGTSVDVSVADEGQYYFVVRAANATVAVDGLPTLPHPVYVMQVVASVTVLPLSPSIVDGATQQFTATARDQDNVVIPNPTLYWASSNHGAATTNQSGLVTTVGPGQTTITAVSKGTPGSATLTVTPQPASKLVFTTPPSNTTAGQSITAIKVAIQNPKNEVASSDNTTQVTLAIAANPGSGALSGTATATVVNGVATFSNLSINKSGTGYTLLATAGGAISSATSGTFNIAPGVATQLAFVVQPTAATAGVAISPAMQIEVRDALGNRVTSARDPVTIEFVSNPGAGTLSGSTVVNAIDGIASFSGISVDKAASGYTVRATSGSLTNSPPSNGFTIGAAAAAVLSFSTQPTTTSTDDMISAQVVVKDLFGNIVSAAPPVTLTLGAGSDNATLTGTTTQPVVAGLATFGDLRLDVVEQGYVLVAQSGTLKTATSNAFDMTVGAPAKLAFTVQPTAAEPQGPLNTVQVAIQDASGNQTSVAEDVTLALTNPGGATLSGTLTVTSANGAAEFSDLSVDVTGTGYQLSATASVAGATSDAFAVALDFVDISASDINTCALTVSGSAYCWGFGGVGATGQGSAGGDLATPGRVVGGHIFAAISVGYAHACGIRATDNAAYCWGWGTSGQLGNGSNISEATPVPVSGGNQFIAISAGTVHTCAVRAVDNLAFCWGQQDFGRLGNNATGFLVLNTPQPVAGGNQFASISAGYDHTCAVRIDGAGYCWGRQGNGRLGNNTNIDVAVTSPGVVQGGIVFQQITSGELQSCGVATDNRGYCWGGNGSGQLGVGDFAERLVPTAIANSIRFANLKASNLSTCGASVGGAGFCWGVGDAGRLGNGQVATARETPQAVLGGLRFTRIDAATPGNSATGDHTCGMTTSGAYCWGGNTWGQLGDGSFLQVSIPVRVRGQR